MDHGCGGRCFRGVKIPFEKIRDFLYAEVMNSGEIRKKFLDFFKSKGHTIVPSSSLVPTDPSVLLTTAGMQQFKPYYLEEKSPYGDNVASIQKCFRTSDLDSIGDASHLSFFEMLGNFSFGGYFKENAIKYAYEFITKEMGLKIAYVSVFEGDEKNNIPADEESENIWKSIDPSLKIIRAGRTDNFWGPTGSEGPCGPTSEIYIDGVEIWNLVFNEYYYSGSQEELFSGVSSKKLEKLKTPGIDTGMGLERLAMAAQGKNNIFETDLFAPIIKLIPEKADFDERKKRIIADHMRGIVFLLSDGVRPSNKGVGYILRRLMRRVIAYEYLSQKYLIETEHHFLDKIIDKIVELYKSVPDYSKLDEQNRNGILWKEFSEERTKFLKALSRGLQEWVKLKTINAESVFKLYESLGLPFEVIKEIDSVKSKDLRYEDFEKELQKHQELSRTASAGMFKSGLADNSEMATKYHTATHLLLAALRKILGERVYQKGSNITAERMRLDFSHSEKMTAEQIKEAEDLVNEKIQEDLPVKIEEMSLEEAKKQGAMGVFESKYGEKVKVYTIGPSASSGLAFSQEICAGPHVERTGILGKFKIVKEEASSAGVRRVKAVLE